MRRLYITAAALIALMPFGAAAQLSVVSDKLSVDAGRGGSVLVKNPDKAAANASPTLYTAPMPAGCSLTLKPGATSVPGASDGWLPLAIDSPAPCEPGSYAGRLEVTPGAARSDVTIQVAAIPVPKSWKVTLYRAFPGTSKYLDDSFSIPVQVPALTRVPSEGELILPRELGASLFGDGWLRVKLGTESPTPAKALFFRVDGGGQAGKYSADVTIPGTVGPTKLEIGVKDMVLWPLLVIGASIMLTLKVQRFLSVRRPVLEWKRRTAAAEAALRALPTAAEAFGYDIAADLTAQRRQIDSDASGFEGTANPAAEEQTRIEQAVTQLEQVPPSWKTFVRFLQQLDAALRALPASLTTPPPDALRTGQTEPRLVADARGLLAGGPVTLEQWRLVVGNLSATSPLLATLLPLARQLSVYAAVPGLTPDVQLAIDKTASKLWRTGSADDLARFLIPADLDAIAGQIFALAPGAKKAATLEALATPTIASVSIEPLELPEVRARHIATQVASMDRKLATLAIAIAVLMGLKDYYFDKNFGSLTDYAGLVIYGTGTKLAIDLVRTSLQALTGRRTT